MPTFDLQRIRNYSPYLCRKMEKAELDYAWLISKCLLPGDSVNEEDGTQAFDQMCQRLKIPSRPLLLVVRDPKVMRQVFGAPKGVEGMYDPFTHTILLTEEIFAQLKQPKSLGAYVVAHELGHAEGHPSRRFFLVGGASMATGLGAAAATYNALAPKKADQRDSNAEPEGRLSWIARIGASFFVHSYVNIFMTGLLLRPEEFRADIKAMEAMDNALHAKIGMTEHALREATNQFGTQRMAEFRQEVDQNLDNEWAARMESEDGIGRDELINYILADYLSKNFSREFNVTRALALDAYPSTMERLKNASAHQPAAGR